MKNNVSANAAQPDWRQYNFHQVMVLICDSFEMTHPQMISLRRKLEQVYGTQSPGGRQPVVDVKALAILAFRRFDEHPKAQALTWILQSNAGKLLKSARRVDLEFEAL